MQAEENLVVGEDGGGVEAEESDGGVNGAGLDGASDLADDEAGVIRRRRRGRGRGRRRRRRGGVFD